MVEVLLSTDNICLFHQIFEHFRVPREVRPGLLFIGTPFMVLMRFLLFFMLKGISTKPSARSCLPSASSACTRASWCFT